MNIKMRTVIIVQARMTSTRLPGKVLKEVLGKPLLEYQVERLRRVKLVDAIVIATTVNDTDQPIVDLCNRLLVSYYRGSENDVLARYYNTAVAYKADVVVRITSDCPIIDPYVVDETIKYYFDHKHECDYACNGLKQTYPRGMDTEVFSFEILNEAFVEAVDQSEREHVTLFIHRRPRRYRLANVAYSSNQGHHRWTVDTYEDFELIRNIIAELYPNKPAFNLKDCLDLLTRHPEWGKINAHVEQKACV